MFSIKNDNDVPAISLILTPIGWSAITPNGLGAADPKFGAAAKLVEDGPLNWLAAVAPAPPPKGLLAVVPNGLPVGWVEVN